MKNLYLLFFLFFVACNPSQNNAIKMNLAGFEKTVLPNGTDLVKKYIDGEIVSEEGTVRNGAKTGAWITYFTDKRNKGKIKSIMNFADGKQNGAFLKFSNSGRIELKEFYVNGLLHGEKTVFGLNKIKEISNYKEGKLSGSFKTFYDNGNLQQDSNFENGLKEGKSTFFNMEGEVLMEYEYRNGKALKK